MKDRITKEAEDEIAAWRADKTNTTLQITAMLAATLLHAKGELSQEAAAAILTEVRDQVASEMEPGLPEMLEKVMEALPDAPPHVITKVAERLHASGLDARDIEIQARTIHANAAGVADAGAPTVH